MDINQKVLDLEKERCSLLEDLTEARININKIEDTDDLFDALSKPFDIQIQISDTELEMLKLLNYNMEALQIHQQIYLYIVTEQYELIENAKTQLSNIE